MTARIASILLIFGLLAGCEATSDMSGEKPPEQPAGTFQFEGTVTWNTIEGGFWTIDTADRRKLDPLSSLPAEFRQEGLRVKGSAREVKDAVSVHMVGPIIEIVSIARRP